eukprot:COSAG03_NODE_16819_length_391_cov_1.554795_1_plen_64_part_10
MIYPLLTTTRLLYLKALAVRFVHLQWKDHILCPVWTGHRPTLQPHSRVWDLIGLSHRQLRHHHR